MTEQPETFNEVLAQMDSERIRKFIIEAETFLAARMAQTSNNILAILKVGIGLGLDCGIVTPPEGKRALEIMIHTPEDMVTGWKALGKFISSTGNLMGKVGVDVEIILESIPGRPEAGNCAATLKTFPPNYSFLLDADTGDKISATDVLAYMEPEHASNT